MLSSITPLGERAKGNRWAITVAAHVAGSTTAGAAIGGVAGVVGLAALGNVGSTTLAAAAAVVCVVAAAVDLAGRRLPSIDRQVDDRWLDEYRGWVYGFGFGAQLGAGFATVITTALVPAAFTIAALTASPGGGALVGAAYGFTRGGILLTGWRLVDPERLLAYFARLDRVAGGARVFLAGVAVVAGTATLVGAR